MEQLQKETNHLNLNAIFKKMANLVNKEAKNEDPYKVEKQAQEKQASKFIETNLYDFYFTMISNGYEPTLQQEKLINNYLKNKIKSCVNYQRVMDLDFLQEHLERGYVFSNEIAYTFLSNYDLAPYFQNLLNIENSKKPINTDNVLETKYFKIMNALREIIHTESFGQYAAKEWLNAFHVNDEFNKINVDKELTRYSYSFHSIKNIILFLNEIPEVILPYIPLSRFLDFVAEWNNINDNGVNKEDIQKINKLFKNTLDEYYNKDMKFLFNKTKEIYLDSYLKQKTIEQTKILSKEYNINELPKEIHQIIENIQENYVLLKTDNHHLNNEQLFLIDNLFDKKIPEILQKYLSINPEYRTSLTNLEGKNSLQLMEESLINYKIKLNDIVREVNEQKVNELSAIKRYSKSI